MKKVLSFLLALSMVFALVACGQPAAETTTPAAPAASEAPAAESPAAETIEPIVLRFADTDAADSVPGKAGLDFCAMVEERTGGRVKVEYYPASQLGGDKAIAEDAIAGTIDIAKCSSGNFSQFSSALDWCDLPGLLTGVEHVRAVFTSEYRDEVNALIMEDTGGIALMFDVDCGEPRAIGTTKDKEIRVPSDMNGVKIRSTGSKIELALFDKWGASSTALDWGEVYNSLSQNLVDASYNQVQTFEMNSFGDILKSITPCNQSWVVTIKFIGPAAIEKLGGLDSELFQIVQECALENELWKDEAFKVANASSYQNLRDQGVNIVELTDEEMEEWNKASQEIWSQFVGEDKAITPEFVEYIQSFA